MRMITLRRNACKDQWITGYLCARNCLLLAACCLLFWAPNPGLAHPMGNFSISHYAGIRIDPAFVELRYILDMAEIPTFQEMQQTGIKSEANDPELEAYLASKAEALKLGLVLELDGQPLELQIVSQQIIFPPGAGGLPTMKMGFLFRAPLENATRSATRQLHYRDGNFPERAGWKEVVAEGIDGVMITTSSVPERDRSQQLSNYPSDLLNSPPQVLEAGVTFTDTVARGSEFGVRDLGREEVRGQESGIGSQKSEIRSTEGGSQRSGVGTGKSEVRSQTVFDRVSNGPRVAAELPEPNPKSKIQNLNSTTPDLHLRANQQGTPRSAFTDLVARNRVGFWFLLSAALIAAGLGAFHALEPGHGKTIVAAYLVGSRGTATHACLLGLIVTGSHTAGVYLLGLVTLYASHYVVPEHLYPWLGVFSGLTIAGLGLYLFIRRYSGPIHDHTHGHTHHHHHHDHHHHNQPHHGHPDHEHHTEVRIQEPEDGVRGSGFGVRAFATDVIGAQKADAIAPRSRGPKSEIQNPNLPNPESRAPSRDVSYRELLALGITGGIIPCPAALVVLLSAVALHRVGFGLFLILAFSVGLAAVLIAIGLLMVYAGRFMSSLKGEGPLLTRWLPMASAAAITVLGVAITLRALVTAGLTTIRI
jgi:ABC-type nickel/cobalt efflux system permease component RcnA